MPGPFEWKQFLFFFLKRKFKFKFVTPPIRRESNNWSIARTNVVIAIITKTKKNEKFVVTVVVVFVVIHHRRIRWLLLEGCKYWATQKENVRCERKKKDIFTEMVCQRARHILLSFWMDQIMADENKTKYKNQIFHLNKYSNFLL